uniref:Retrovirus-related Pol polyprotein from transposon TNT 1-94 n=1 Tax=Tanacetum cinerariifolium TaxID=118510 RepID=A0A6L2J7S2_TANCI|nr:retrovirus-related Pol polyprotein from transposon TNT 1-94 [Tanacetum cinerariifolium]
MFHNFDQFMWQFERENFHEVNAKTCLEVLRTQFKEFFASKRVTSSDYLNRLNQENFKDYTGCEPETYRSNLLKCLDILAKCIDKRVLKYGELQMKESEVKAIKKTEKLLNEAIPHEHEIEKSFRLQPKDAQINPIQVMHMQEGKVDMGKKLDAGLVATEISETESNKQDTSSKLGNDTTLAVDADMRPVNDQEPLAEVQLTAQHNILANEQQHITPHYLHEVREYVFANPHHMIAPDSFMNSSKESYGSNDMAHNYYLEEAKKKTQDINTSLTPREISFAITHHTPNAGTPKPMSNNQTFRNWTASKSSNVTLKVMQKADHSRNPSLFSDSKHFVCSTCQKCVFNANHDAYVTKFLKEVNSCAKGQSPKSRNSIKPVEKKSNVNKPERWISKGYRLSPNKSSFVYEKTNTHRSCLRGSRNSNLMKKNYGICRQHFRPRSSKKRKVCASMRFIFKKEKSSCFRPFSSTIFIFSHARSVIKWINTKYALEILKKYGMDSSDPVDTPLVEKSKLDLELQGKTVDPTHYHGMIGSLMYLTSSRPDLVFVLCMCAWHIDVMYHFIKEQVENSVVELYFSRTEYQLAGIFTKALPRERFEFFINKLGVKSMSPEILKSLVEEEE